MKETSHGSSVITKFYVDRTQTKSVNHEFSWPTAFKLMVLGRTSQSKPCLAQKLGVQIRQSTNFSTVLSHQYLLM